LVISAVAVFFGRATDVVAVGPPTDNSTIPSFPVNERPKDEIWPQVPYMRQGVTSQPDSPQPGIIPRLTGTAGEDISTITGDETWFLDLDVNMPNPPGWLYIYEYFPDVDGLQGRWIAYKWELSHSGLWRLGPFTPEGDEAEGEHIYGIWFYSDGQWAGEGPDGPQDNRVYLIYEKSQPAEPEPGPVPPPSPPALPPREVTFWDKVSDFFSTPDGIAVGVLVLIGIGMLGFFLYRRYFRRLQMEYIEPLPDETEPEEVSPVMPATLAGARIALPNGTEIQLTGNSRIIGRGDLARVLELNDLGLISRRHFEIKSQDGQFHIEDLGSTNGTVFNGTDIRGKGPVVINDDDIIEPAGVISLKFYLL